MKTNQKKKSNKITNSIKQLNKSDINDFRYSDSVYFIREHKSKFRNKIYIGKFKSI